MANALFEAGSGWSGRLICVSGCLRVRYCFTERMSVLRCQSRVQVLSYLQQLTGASCRPCWLLRAGKSDTEGGAYLWRTRRNIMFAMILCILWAFSVNADRRVLYLHARSRCEPFQDLPCDGAMPLLAFLSKSVLSHFVWFEDSPKPVATSFHSRIADSDIAQSICLPSLISHPPAHASGGAHPPSS